ncbi:MAG: hypothetical protein ACYTF9_07395 [Planctomycetota bacterium]|jgi:hypothetical protein
MAGGGYRAITDVDILAVRLPGAGRVIWKEGESAAEQRRLFDPDPCLLDDGADDRTDFIIAEVKEGRAEVNRGGRNPNTIIAALRRFAFIEPSKAETVADKLLQRGAVDIDAARVRLFAFGSRHPEHRGPWKVVLLKDCVDYLMRGKREHGDLVSASQLKDPALGMLALLSKAGSLK